MFIVTITRTTFEERPAGKEWETTGEVTGMDDPKYAYAPEITKKKEIEQKIYEQIVEELDVGAVVSVVNKIKPY